MQNLDERKQNAIELFRAFQGRAPGPGEIVQVEGIRPPMFALEVGDYIGIAYKALGNGKDYYHEFPASSRPKIFVSYDGRQIYIIGGGYRFSDRGFLK